MADRFLYLPLPQSSVSILERDAHLYVMPFACFAKEMLESRSHLFYTLICVLGNHEIIVFSCTFPSFDVQLDLMLFHPAISAGIVFWFL